jgi:hypothetical protein
VPPPSTSNAPRGGFCVVACHIRIFTLSLGHVLSIFRALRAISVLALALVIFLVAMLILAERYDWPPMRPGGFVVRKDSGHGQVKLLYRINVSQFDLS